MRAALLFLVPFTTCFKTMLANSEAMFAPVTLPSWTSSLTDKATNMSVSIDAPRDVSVNGAWVHPAVRVHVEATIPGGTQGEVQWTLPDMDVETLAGEAPSPEEFLPQVQLVLDFLEIPNEGWQNTLLQDGKAMETKLKSLDVPHYDTEFCEDSLAPGGSPCTLEERDFCAVIKKVTGRKSCQAAITNTRLRRSISWSVQVPVGKPAKLSLHFDVPLDVFEPSSEAPNSKPAKTIKPGKSAWPTAPGQPDAFCLADMGPGWLEKKKIKHAHWMTLDLEKANFLRGKDLDLSFSKGLEQEFTSTCEPGVKRTGPKEFSMKLPRDRKPKPLRIAYLSPSQPPCGFVEMRPSPVAGPSWKSHPALRGIKLDKLDELSEKDVRLYKAPFLNLYVLDKEIYVITDENGKKKCSFTEGLSDGMPPISTDGNELLFEEYSGSQSWLRVVSTKDCRTRFTLDSPTHLSQLGIEKTPICFSNSRDDYLEHPYLGSDPVACNAGDQLDFGPKCALVRNVSQARALTRKHLGVALPTGSGWVLKPGTKNAKVVPPPPKK